ncbi:MAG: HAMP domain-containing protein, partial [Coriobacteriales bacterium]|nr:HAMP domain-containing protein [Coriobacteriales bacterium]
MDLNTGELRELGTLSAPVFESGRLLVSSGAVDGSVYVAEAVSAQDGSSTLHIGGMDVESGQEVFAQTIEADFNIIWFNVASDKLITALSSDSHLYRYRDGDWEALFVPEPAAAAIDVSVGADGAIYLFMTSKTEPVLYRIQADSPAPTPQRIQAQNTAEALGLSCLNDDSYIAELPASGGESDNTIYAVTLDGETSFITAAQPSAAMVWKDVSRLRLLGSLALLSVLCVIVLRIRLRAHISIVIKQILAAVAVIVVGLSLLLAFNRILVTDTLRSDRYLALGERAAAVGALIDSERFMRIDWDKPIQDDYYQEVKGLFDGLSGYIEINWWQSPDEMPPFWDVATIVIDNGQMSNVSLVEYRLFRVLEGKAYTAVYEGAPVNLDASYLENIAGNQNLVSLLTEYGLPVRTKVFDANDEGYWLSVYAPLYDDGQLIGFIEVSESALGLEARVGILNSIIIAMATFIMFFAVLLVVLMLFITLRRLRQLKVGAEAVASGDYEVHIAVRTQDEAGDIAQAFNTMAASVKDSIEDITKTSEGYSRFVPHELITALGRDSIREVEAGAHIDLEASNLLISTSSFAEYGDEDLFHMLNEYYETIMPPIVDSGGIVDHFSASNLSVIYKSGTADALDSVIATYAALDGLNRALAKRKIPGIVCHALLGHTDTLLGVAGTNQRLDIITVSPLGNRAEKMAELGRICGCRLLVAQTAFEALGASAAHYPYRWAGYLRVGSRQLRLYDFYFCEQPELRRAKEQCRDLFERGVSLYYEGHYQQASSTFVRVV